MNLAACPHLPRRPETGTWYRAIGPQFLRTALHSAHSTGTRSRFSGGPILPVARRFQILYFAEDPLVAAFEYGSLFGSLWSPSGYVPNPRRGHVILNVAVNLVEVVDLTDVPAAQQPLNTTAQELTGDWDGYSLRASNLPVTLKHPSGLAPTQELGEALFQTGIEGFRSISARLPTHTTLMVLPQNLKAGGYLEYRDQNGALIARVS